MQDLRFNKPPEPEKPEEKVDPIKPKIWQKVKSKIKKSAILSVLALLIIASLAGIAFNFYLKAQKLELQSQTNTPTEVQKIVAEVGKLIVLPKDEEPTVATISNVEKLRNQAFFANAQNGDKVLIYTKASKAILYDPVAKMIIEVSPITSGSATGSAATVKNTTKE